MFVTLRDAGAFDHAFGTFLHATVAGDGGFAGAVRAGDELPAGAAAERAILERHGEEDTCEEGKRQGGKVEMCGSNVLLTAHRKEAGVQAGTPKAKGIPLTVL
jgi:hypothetical protein